MAGAAGAVLALVLYNLSEKSSAKTAQTIKAIALMWFAAEAYFFTRNW